MCYEWANEDCVHAILRDCIRSSVISLTFVFWLLVLFCENYGKNDRLVAESVIMHDTRQCQRLEYMTPIIDTVAYAQSAA
ncbi:hypothetical protein BDV11DRAFT_198515 [Aspergillus similis]